MLSELESCNLLLDEARCLYEACIGQKGNLDQNTT